ncbi:protein of unknown function [Chitinophaga costaii]|uniref:DUF4292 domain-containing protein n=1 Tax=Chitinophaga costaii TaxID=1335309 RepID=A0A1C4FAC5_9BACT|nr:DUF4292 domain-containing protein [Chitinophaga costaii]PUZ21173.1 DUF4292 domain-containing protein [Chitinophaga costaii]SCC52451.1 protein of unknown function [Chitinophaga costaii]
MNRTFTNIAITFLITLTGLLGSACRHSRHIARPVFVSDTTAHTTATDTATAANSEADLYRQRMLARVKRHYISFSTFSAKLKLDYDNDQGKSLSLTANIRIRKDSAVWISISAPIVGEVARALITPDSLKVINKFEKKLILRKLSDAHDILNIPMDFNTLQDLIVGNPVFFTDSVYNVVRTPSVISFDCNGGTFMSVFNVFADDFNLQQSKVTDKDSTLATKRSCELTYGDYHDLQGHKFANSRRIFVSEKHVTKIGLDFNRADFDQAVSLPFSIPASGYTVQ